jgi:ribosomal-protein-serine acetyltransferase
VAGNTAPTTEASPSGAKGNASRSCVTIHRGDQVEITRSSSDAGTDFGFLFRETATGALVGGGGVHRRVGPGAVEIGYWVRSDRHNRGYATRATQAMTDAAFTFLADIDRIEIHTDRTNIASARVPEKLGYRLLRTEQREKVALGHTGDGYVWQRRRDEWTPPPHT